LFRSQIFGDQIILAKSGWIQTILCA